MPTLGICGNCGAEIPAASPAGFCTRCLFELGLGSALTRDPADKHAAIDNPGSVTAESVDPPPDQRGTDGGVLLRIGDYELLEEIDRGGMGVVYRARQVSLDRIVAVKVILVGSFATREQVLRFRAEAEASARLRHPGIVTIHETGESEGRPYFSMDYMPGGNLTNLIQEEPLSAREAARLVKKIAEAVHYAHGQGILHRDLKPTNVLLDELGEPRISDFGLAKRMHKDEFLTVTGQVLGSPNFMPPEQASGRIGRAGPACDIYSLGGILFYLVTGRAPFVGETAGQTIHLVLTSEAISPRLLNPGVPADIATICLKCLEKDPARRYATAAELADDLGRFLADEPIHARPISRSERAWRWCRRNRALAASLAFGLVLLLALGVGSPIAAFRIDRARARAEAQSYSSNMRLALENPTRAFELVSDSDPDLRGWEWRYLWQQVRNHELFIFGRHHTDVRAITVSSNGQWLATGDYRGYIKLWEIASRREIASCRGRGFSMFLRFTPDDRLLLSGNWRGGLYRWTLPDLQAFGPVLTTNSILAIGLRDDRLYAVADEQQQIIGWNLADGREIVRNLGFFFPPDVGAFSHDGRLWAGASNHFVTINEVDSGRQLAALAGGLRFPNALCFSRDNRLLAASGREGTVEIWDVETYQRIAVLPGHESVVTTGHFSTDGKLLVTASFDHTIRVWDVTSFELVTVLRGHTGEVYSITLLPDGQTIASASGDGTIRFWSIRPRRQPNRHYLLPPDLKQWSLSPDGRWLLLVLDGHRFTLLNLQTFEQTPPSSLGSDSVTAVALLPGGKSVAVGERNGRVRLMTTDEPLRSDDLASLKGSVLKLAVSADGKVLAAESADLTVTTWDLHERRRLGKVQLPAQTVGERLPLSRDGGLLLTPYLNGQTDLWNLRDGRTTLVITNQRLYITGATFFRDGLRVATCSYDGTARVWNHSRKRELMRMFSDMNGFSSIALSPDERRLAAGDDLGRVRKVKLWDVASGLEVAVLPGHQDSITDIAFWDDGNTIVSVSGDVVIVWAAPGPEEIERAEAALARK